MPTLIQQQINNKNATGTSLTVTLPALPKVGSTLIMTTGMGDQTLSVSTVTGGGVATWTRLVKNAGSATSGSTVEIWEGPNSNGSNAAVIITTTAGIEMGANVSEWRGLFYNMPDVSVNTSVGSSVSPVSGTASTLASPTLVFGAAYYKNTTTPSAGPTNGFTALTNTAVTTLATLVVAYKVVASPGSTSTGWTISTSNWGGVLISFGLVNITNNNYQSVKVGDGMSVSERIR